MLKPTTFAEVKPAPTAPKPDDEIVLHMPRSTAVILKEVLSHVVLDETTLAGAPFEALNALYNAFGECRVFTQSHNWQMQGAVTITTGKVRS